MRPSKLDAHAGRIAEMQAQAMSTSAIARTLGVARTTLISWLDSKGQPSSSPESDGKPSRVEMLEDEVRRLRRALTTDRKHVVHRERVTSAIEEAISVVTPPEQLWLYAADPQDATADAHHRQLVALSDFHGGEVVNPHAVNGLNAYSWEIMEARVDEVVRALLSHKRRSPELTGLDIAFVGDQCSGSNHQELAETNQYPLAEQGVRMGYLMGDLVMRLAPHYPDIRAFGVVGNHPRLNKAPAAKNVYDNFDWVAYKIAAQHVADCETVDFVVPESGAHFHEIAGQTLYVWHGDGIRSSMPGVPWGGVMRRVNELRRAHADIRIDGFLLGHFHQANAMYDLGIYMNGSLKGTDEWVLKNFGAGGRPSQLLLTFDERRSRLTDSRLITPTAGLPTRVAR